MVLICTSVMVSDVERLFIFGHLCAFFGKMSIQTLSTFYLGCFLAVQLFSCCSVEFLIYWGYEFLIRYMMQIFSSVLQVAFSFCQQFPLLWESFQFDVAPLVYFCFCCLCFSFQVALVKNSPATAGDTGLKIPGSGRSPGVGHSHPLQYSCLENPMDRGAWWATVHRAAKSWTRLKRLTILLLQYLIQKIVAKTDVKEITIYVFLQEFCCFRFYIQVFNPF